MTIVNNSPLSFSSSPIGVFDSGVGGLSILRSLRAQLPAEDFLYIADTAHAPYGEKSEDYIRTRCFIVADFLISQGAKALVIACNTATAVALDAMRAHYTLPIMALEPALKPAVLASTSKVVGVLATRRTVESARFLAQIARYNHLAQIIAQPCPRLVTLIETGALDNTDMRKALHDYIDPLIMQGVDGLVLGCTHFVFLRQQITALAGSAITLYDSGDGVARVLQQKLATLNALNTPDHHGQDHFWSSAATAETTRVMQLLWGTPISVVPLPAA